MRVFKTYTNRNDCIFLNYKFIGNTSSIFLGEMDFYLVAFVVQVHVDLLLPWPQPRKVIRSIFAKL